MAVGIIKIPLGCLTGLSEFERPSLVGGNLERKPILMFMGKGVKAHSELLQLGEALDLSAAGSPLFQSGEQEGGEDGDDRYDQEQFQERERAWNRPALKR